MCISSCIAMWWIKDNVLYICMGVSCAWHPTWSKPQTCISMAVVAHKRLNVYIFVVCLQAFGVPTIIVHDSDKKKHMMFGSDRMHIIAMLLSKSLHFQSSCVFSQRCWLILLSILTSSIKDVRVDRDSDGYIPSHISCICWICFYIKCLYVFCMMCVCR